MLGRRRWWEILMPWLNPYSDWAVRGRGRKDGNAQPPIPAWNAESLPPFLRMLCQAGNQDLRALAKDWHDEDRRFKTDWALAGRAFDSAQKAAGDADDEAQHALDHYEKTHGHRLVVTLSRWRYGLLVALLCLFEFPLNALVFRGFGESELFTWLMAFGFGVCLTLCAHYLGKFLREQRTALRLGLSALLVVLPCAAIIGVATLRANYLTQKAGASSAWSPDVMIPFFIAWNLILYAVATIASYRHHEPFNAEVASTQRGQSRTEHARERGEAAFEEARVKREKKFLEKQEHAVWLQEEVKRLGSVYWIVNLQVRKDMGEKHETDFPKSYYHEMDAVMPEELKSLVWDNPPATHSEGPARRRPLREKVAQIQMQARPRLAETDEGKHVDQQDALREVAR
jgi:hypothetical protein